MPPESFSFDGNAALQRPKIPRPEPRRPKLELVKPPAKEEVTDPDIIESAPLPSNDTDVEEIEAAIDREPGELQKENVVSTFEIKGFSGIQVAATLEKKNVRKGKTERNEDTIITDPETGLIGVLDGLGGEGAEGSGAKASTAAEAAIPAAYAEALAAAKHQKITEIAQQIVDRQVARLNTADPVIKLARQQKAAAMFEGVVAKDPEMGRKALALLESVRRANDAVLATGDEKTRGKTTACVGFVHKTPAGQSYAVVANIGDSIAFKRRGKTGEMIPLTEEDSLLNLMTQAGAITSAQLEMMKQSPEQRVNFPISLELVQAMGGDRNTFEGLTNKGITELPLTYKKLKRAMSRSMGVETAEAALTIRELQPGDELIFMTDIADNFENQQSEEMDLVRMAQVAGNAGSQTERLTRLREAAKQGPKDDDAALVSARVM